jgi:hypothetical protein
VHEFGAQVANNLMVLVIEVLQVFDEYQVLALDPPALLRGHSIVIKFGPVDTKPFRRYTQPQRYWP